MTMQKLLDFAASDQEAGFRLDRLELFNWGTFDRKVWNVEPSGRNGLLTGDIGSGKSTLVDAVVTLLVPHHRIVYNKAAGAETRERTLASYIRGEYKTERDETSHLSRAVSLRDENSYTVLLARFTNQGFAQEITLAQVFWLKPDQSNPERFFVVASRHLTIKEDFSNFGSSIADLRKRLRKAKGVYLFPTFREYSNRFRHLFGITSEQALNLFYQTVSMKSVGNLTEFVRRHMLEKSDVENRIDEVRRNFDNLDHAHDSVLKARKRIEQLEPLVADCLRLDEINREAERLRSCREALHPWFCARKAELLTKRLEELDTEIDKLTQRLTSIEGELRARRTREMDLRTAIDDHGGRRLEELRREIDRISRERERILARFEAYNRLAQKSGLESAASEDDFVKNRGQAKNLLGNIDRGLEQIGRKQVDIGITMREKKDRYRELEKEIESLRSRKSNIPLKSLLIRKNMAEIVALSEEELPFAGELLQVADEEKKWEGGIERVLHNFGLSLLVANEHYGKVSHYVELTNLKGRIVYFRVGPETAKVTERPAEPRLLPRKMCIKPDTPFYNWLDRELSARFNYTCCDTLDDFRRLPKAFTIHGQIKSGGRRHEKDDRRNLNDRSRYVLGWTNKEKIKALEEEADRLNNDKMRLSAQIEKLQKENQTQTTLRDCCRDLLQVEGFSEIYWQPLTLRIEELNEERRKIEEGSDILHTLRSQLKSVEKTILNLDRERTGIHTSLGGCREQQKARREELDEVSRFVSFPSDETQKELAGRLHGFRQEVLGDKRLTLRNLDTNQSLVRRHIQKLIDNKESRRRDLSGAIIRRMGEFRSNWPAETVEMDTSIEAGPEYGRMLESLIKEDLPRHEARFKELLNQGTINSIALFQNQLDKEHQDIVDKISAINRSLKETEYNPGSYIELVMDKTQDPDVRNFKEELKQCLAHSLEDNQPYNEGKFRQVKNLIDRFNGREGYVDLDRRWTRRVTDVRNWFAFSASEKWLEDDTEKEFYSDSAGKSGGQKEKLAYTILASALAYQFGLEWGAVRSRSFRFVVIDEAFGRGSDESTRYGLELFKRLNLQLLIVTPLQKIQIIEDYINAVHFVHNEGGKNSMIRNLTIEEYRQEKEKRAAG